MSTSQLFSDTLGGASAEILIMMGTSFILGCLLHWAFSSNWKKRHETIKMKNQRLDGTQKVALIANEELQSQLTQLAAELKQVTANYKRAKSNLMATKEKYSELSSHMSQFDVMAAEHSKMKRKMRRLEKIRDDQKEQLDSLKVELLNSRIQAASPAPAKAKKKPAQVRKAQSKTSNGVSKSVNRKDDLTRISGIGPKSQSILHEHGIQTFTQLGRTGIKKLKMMMEESGSKSRTFDPKAWTTQARELKKMEKV